MRLPWAPSPSSPSCFPAQGAVGGGGGGGTTPLPFLRRICRIHWGANPCLVPFLCLLLLGRRDVLLERRVWEVVLLGVLRARPRDVEFGAPARLCGVKPRERLHDHPRSHSGAPVPVGVSTSRVPGQFAFFRRPKPRRDLPNQASSAEAATASFFPSRGYVGCISFMYFSKPCQREDSGAWKEERCMSDALETQRSTKNGRRKISCHLVIF